MYTLAAPDSTSTQAMRHQHVSYSSGRREMVSDLVTAWLAYDAIRTLIALVVAGILLFISRKDR